MFAVPVRTFIAVEVKCNARYSPFHGCVRPLFPRCTDHEFHQYKTLLESQRNYHLLTKGAVASRRKLLQDTIRYAYATEEIIARHLSPTSLPLSPSLSLSLSLSPSLPAGTCTRRRKSTKW